MSGKPNTRSPGPACAALLVVALATAPAVDAQHVSWARSASMAGADFALTRGVAAVELNPANIFIEDSVVFSFSSTLQAGRVLVAGPGLRQFADIVTAAGVGDPALLAEVPTGGLRIDAVSEGVTAKRIAETLDLPDPTGGARVPTFGFTYKGGGIVLRQHTVLSALVSRELIDLAVNGFNPDQINEYAAKSTAIRSFTLTSATVSFSKRYSERLTGGFGIRYVRGEKLLTGRVFEPEIDVDNEVFAASAAAIEARGGNGLGLDLGVTYQLGRTLYASLAIQNVWQRMHWSDQLWVSQSALSQDDFGASDLRTIINRFKASKLDVEAATLEAYLTSQDLYGGAFFPRITRAGIGWRARNGTELQLTGAKSWGRGTLIPARPDRVAAGVNYPWKVLRLRSGFALEQGGARQIAFGIAFDGGLSIDLGGGWTQGSGKFGSMQGLSFSLGVGLVFTDLGS